MLLCGVVPSQLALPSYCPLIRNPTSTSHDTRIVRYASVAATHPMMNGSTLYDYISESTNVLRGS
ncbi:hypothetical protein M404DRAFT_994557 [Pisolithus tinctorius Marx 270]|uniref:Uncharacterized protein n=1 Tax=Pisolithus tinctorius Marx 270 TaxID=870435 RepID=A0A0C3PT64_PISTI|nr:hypothetical protein M404DRAFT_994557 [Pisolithus tinctorius Marx 270]